MSIKTYIIEKGKHGSKGLNFGFTFKKKIKFRACFTSSCIYDLGNNNNYDINKLFGFSTFWHHHKQSARVGWRCIDGKHLQLLTYSYNDSKRDMNEVDLLGEVLPEQWFICEIVDYESHYEYRFQIEEDVESNTVVKQDKKQKDWFIFNYFLFPYFGGDQSAPHKIKLFIERL